MSRHRTAALVGNPNAGKSALFNALTGARQKIANYPGVTVERKSGRLVLPSGEPVDLTSRGSPPLPTAASSRDRRGTGDPVPPVDQPAPPRLGRVHTRSSSSPRRHTKF